MKEGQTPYTGILLLFRKTKCLVISNQIHHYTPVRTKVLYADCHKEWEVGTGCFKRLGNNKEKGILSTQRTVADFILDKLELELIHTWWLTGALYRPSDDISISLESDGRLSTQLKLVWSIMIHHKEPQLRIFCSYSKPEIKPDLNFVLAARKIHTDFVSSYIGWPDLSNESTVSPVKFEFLL